jgi:hypothetical protein
MRRLRKTAMALLVWATAVSSLLGSIPHFTCRCPDGTLKEFCSGQATSESSCCCNGKCCCSTGGAGSCCQGKSAPTQEGKTEPSCCQASITEAPSKSADGRPDEVNAQKIGPNPRSRPEECVLISRSCCQKTLAKAESRTLVRPETEPVKQVEFGLAPLAPLCVGYNPSPLALRNGWSISRLPPPTDLVIAFQHFVI